LKIKVVKVKTIIRSPRWYRNPRRWWRWRRMARQHAEWMRDPLFRALTIAEERAMLFGIGCECGAPGSAYGAGCPDHQFQPDLLDS
jgi:hypothetical protein